MRDKFITRFKPGLYVIMPLIMAFMIPDSKTINSSVYEWTKLTVKKNSTGSVREILKGPTRSLDMFEIKAVTLNGNQMLKEYTVEKGFDELLIVKSGLALITVNDEGKQLEEGSLVVASQGDRVSIKNPGKGEMTFYSFLLNPRESNGAQPAFNRVPAVFKEWNKLEFKTNANGGRRDVMKQATSALKELEIHVTTLKEGLPSHAPHNHPDEEIILVRFGRVEETINGAPFQLGPGSAIFLTNDDMHGISNVGSGQCEYYAIRWLTY
jgi:mannose-6-phosphate isomerase-like protein (cupin superfamily)